MNKFKMALIQMECKFCDIQYNVGRAEEKIREAHANGAQFVCLPEGFNTGYYCFGYEKMKQIAEPIDGDTITRMRSLAKELNIYIVAPIMLAVATGIVQNSAVMIDDEGKILGDYSKTHLVGQEQLYLQRGREYPVFHTKYGKFGIVICYDICFPETTRILALKGADLIICPAAWRDGSYFKDWMNKVSMVRALDNTVYIALINCTGVLPDSPFCGSTQFVDPIGNVMAMCSVDKEEILYQDIDMGRVYKERMDNTILIDRHPDDYELLAKL
ncbi:carbon-nitrogen hydrolase family protein [Lutispora sp.]|uniref:carbon-nitrogen hydrolase family protein n=1 Tax=Lutispora sp. TaxID=2828727 RepID=UPI002B20885D|nr:carbon-nitrogen hydrolase family protein [Lutispora sp.]MEA4961385.1 carbon-nitrogen hydrolase family protein [Lutispora sp.]